MVDPVYHTENVWIKAENTEFKELIHKLGTYKRAGQQILFLEVILAFISQYYGGLSEWPAYKMQDVSQVELHDLSYIENAVERVTENQDSAEGPEGPALIQQALNAANHMLKDLYENPIFKGSGLPDQVLNNFKVIFDTGKTSNEIQWKKEVVVRDRIVTTARFPQLYLSGSQKVVLARIWTGTNLKIGSPEYQAWMAKMEGIQSKLQETNTLFTNMSSTEQSKYKFIMGNLKEFLGTWKSLNKNIVSVRNTALQNMARG